MQLERLRGGPLSHVWLRLGDGRALDPSADQFVLGLLPVYLGEPLAPITPARLMAIACGA